MFALDALFDHIRRISSNVEIIGSLVQFTQFWQLMSELGHKPEMLVASTSSLLRP
jgi:hypothetical protein